jgi:hypothetical protein
MYEFDDLPLSPIEPATNVLVAGSAMSGARELFLEMLAPGDEEGVIIISTNTGSEKLFERLEGVGDGVDGQQVGIVDAVSQQQGVAADRANVRTVSSPRDLTGIGMELTDLYESFYGRGITDVRTGLESISTLLMYAELPTVFRFLHVFTGRVSTADGMGVFVVDPSSHDDQTTQTLNQLFDARVDVREGEDGPEFKVQGLSDQPREWTSF